MANLLTRDDRTLWEMNETDASTIAASGAAVLMIRCAWCGKDLGTKDGHGVEGETSGICEDCARRWLSDVQVSEALAEREMDRRE
jgi:hypothetical protein